MPALKNPRRERFVQELVKGQPLGEAYRLAGYTPHKAHGTRLLRQPAVERRYDELRSEALRHTKVTANQVINELAAIAFANIIDFIKLDADGVPHPDLTRLTRAQAAALLEVSVSGDKTRRVRFKLSDKRAALSDLGRMLGLFRERVEVSGQNGGPVEVETQPLSDYELAGRIEFILLKAKAEGTTDQLPDSLRPFLELMEQAQ